MNKEQQELLDEAYSEYGDSHWISPSNPKGKLLSDQLFSVIPMEHSKESFFNECKTNPKFSNKWGLKIEERELDIKERMNIYIEEHPHWVMIAEHSFFDTHKIPTKLITVTYNNQTIKSYE